MDYQISEEEFNRLESVGDHLGLIAGLLACANESDWLSNVTASQFFAFVHAQRAVVARVIAATSERQTQALVAKREESKALNVPQVLITPELLMNLMDAACGTLTDSEALIKLWDGLDGVSAVHPPYVDARHHFVDVMRARGLVMHIGFLDSHPSRAFVPMQQDRPQGTTPTKPRKREKLARVGA